MSGLGYGNQELNSALKDQIDKLIHSSNLYYNTACGEAAEALKGVTGMDRVFFTNSGTEAVEGALKAARKYARKKKTGRYAYIAMQDCFHGRSMGALSVTEHEAYRAPFKPLIPGVSFAKFNDLDSVKELVTDETCAIILEPLQGEGGINMATQEFMEGIRRLCHEEGILMICDEIQCGMGRTGSLFAFEQYNIKPDILTVAKALGCGVPVGAFLANDKTKDALVPGDHGTTYGGNPLACAAVNAVLDIFEKEHVLDNVREVSVYLEKVLDELVLEFDCVKERRGMGLMQGLELVSQVPVGTVVNRCIEQGLIVISAGGNVLRMVPPLVISKKNVDEMAAKLREALKN